MNIYFGHMTINVSILSSWDTRDNMVSLVIVLGCGEMLFLWSDVSDTRHLNYRTLGTLTHS